MAVKLGTATMYEIKGGRGLAYKTDAYMAREQVVAIPALITPMILGQPLTPGQETAVLVQVAGLRANADVKHMKATLQVFEDASPAPTPNTLHVKEGDGSERTFVVSAEGPSGLSNVTLRFDPGEVFWTNAGRLAPGRHDIPVDFAAQVNAYLDHTAHAEGSATLKFMIKTDTPGRVIISIETNEFTLLQTQTWSNELDGTLRADRNLTLDFNSDQRLPLSAIAPLDGQALSFMQLRMDASGQFSPERVLENTESQSVARNEFCTINNEFSVARGFILNPAVVKGNAVQCAGCSLYLRLDAEAEIYVELQVDAAPVNTEPGKGSGPTSGLTIPASGAPLARANLKITPPPEMQGQPSEQWVYVKMENPAELRVGLPYWLIIKGIRGQVYLGLLNFGVETAAGQALSAERLRINRGGQLWKGLLRGLGDQVRARLSLVYIPGPDNGVAAIKVAVETSDSAAGTFTTLVDPGPQVQSLTVPLKGTFSTQGAVLNIHSNAAGTLTIANVIQEYASS